MWGGVRWGCGGREGGGGGGDGITHRPNTGHLTLGVDTFAIEVSVSSGNNGDRSG